MPLSTDYRTRVVVCIQKLVLQHEGKGCKYIGDLKLESNNVFQAIAKRITSKHEIGSRFQPERALKASIVPEEWLKF